MKKILLSILAVGFVFAGTANITVSDCTDNGDGTVTFALDMQSDSDLYGLQFTVDPSGTLTAGSGSAGGLAAEAGWLVQIGQNGTVLGFSMNGSSIPVQETAANLTNLSFAGTCDAGLGLLDATPGDAVNVWGIDFTFGGHSFSSFECSDSMYGNIDDCTDAGHSWDSVTMEYTWTSSSTESIENMGNIVKEFNLNSNYPNPFNPSTTIGYDVANAGEVTLSVFNMKGQEINVLAQGYHSINSYSVIWNGTDMYGVEMPAGMYIYKLVADGFIQSNKMLFVK